MTLIDYLLWAAILVAGLTLATWYGASWRAVAKAMVRAQQPIVEEPVGASRVDGHQDTPTQGQRSDVLV